MTIPEIIEQLQKIHRRCETAQYSLDDSHQLTNLAIELRLHAYKIAQCCT